MSETEVNPYQAPKSSLERDFKVLGVSGYRDGADLIVREGFKAPRICVMTGQQVEEYAHPESIMLKSTTTRKLVYGVILGVIFGTFVGIAFYQFPILKYLPRTSIIIFVVFMISVITISFKPKGGG